MKNTKIYIYSLCDPETKEVRYIGKTNNVKSRYNNHITSDIKTHCCNWIKSLKNKGFLPEINIIEEVTIDNWIEREQYWISQYKNLTNQTIGGEGLSGIRASEETKKLMSNNRIGKFTNKLLEEDVLIIRELLIKGYSTSEIAFKYNVSKSTIQHIRENRTWKHLGQFKVNQKASTINPDKIQILYELFNQNKSVKEIKQILNICIATIAKQRKLWKKLKE